MVQEKKMESRLGPLDVILYAAILCVHYPLRIVLASYRLIKATIVKAALIPRLILGYTTALLIIILESSEKKIIEILNVLASLPSYLLKKTNQYIKLFGGKKSEITNDPKTEVKEEKDLTNYTELITSAVKKASDTVYGLLVAFANFWRHILLIPLKLSLLPLKVAKNLIATLLNLSSDQKTEMDRGDRRSLATHLGDYLFIVLASLQYYLIYVIAIIERLMSQLSSLARTTPRHIFDIIKIIYLRLLQFVALTVIFLYNVGRYSFFYVFIFVSRALRRRTQEQVTESTPHANSSGEDLEVLVQENLKLKEALARAKTKNENHKCEQQIKDLEGQLGEVQVAFDKERQEYKREIDKLKQYNQKSSEFNSERTKLQSEIQKLQALIAEVQQENEEEGRIKKQEAIDLDNERNQLQEQIQTLQLQVVALQKQNEAQASSYSESRKQMEMDFEKEREDLLQEIEHLQKRVEEMEDAQNEAKHRYVQLLSENQTIQEHMRKLQESLEILQKSNAAHRLKKHKSNHKNSDKGSTSVTVINKNSTDFRYEITPSYENGGTQFQSTIDEVIRQLDQLYHFNNERFMLHTEMEKLQALIEDMHKKNEERINLDNERKELQTLQEQVADLQNQNMVMALSYSEAKRLMETNFEREREEFLHEVQHLLNKAEESEEARKQDKELHRLKKNRTIMNIQHSQTTSKDLQEQDNGTCLAQLEELCNVCKRIEKEMVNFGEACQNLSNINNQQSSIDQVQKVLVGLTDRLGSQTGLSQHEEERSVDDQLHEEVQGLQSQLSEVLQKGMESYEALEARNKAIDTNMIVVKSQIEKIHDSLHGMKAHLELRDEKLDRLRVCHTRAVKVLRDEKSKVSSLRAQIDSMEKAIEEAVEYKIMLHATSAENEMKIKSLEAENAELQHNLNNLQIRMDTKEREHENERKHDEKLHQATITELEREIEELQKENYQKTVMFNEKMKELQTEKLHERDEMVNRLRMHHERAMKEFKDEKLQISHLRDHVDSLEKSLREAQEEKLRYQTMLNENDLKISRLLHENSELKRDLADLQMDIEENDKRHENLRDNDDKLHEAVVVELKREIENVENENQQNVLKLTEKIQNLQSERVILLDHNMELQNLVEFLNKEVEKWKRAKRPFFGTK